MLILSNQPYYLARLINTGLYDAYLVNALTKLITYFSLREVIWWN